MFKDQARIARVVGEVLGAFEAPGNPWVKTGVFHGGRRDEAGLLRVLAATEMQIKGFSSLFQLANAVRECLVAILNGDLLDLVGDRLCPLRQARQDDLGGSHPMPRPLRLGQTEMRDGRVVNES